MLGSGVHGFFQNLEGQVVILDLLGFWEVGLSGFPSFCSEGIMVEIRGMLLCQAFCSVRVLPCGFYIPCATVIRGWFM